MTEGEKNRVLEMKAAGVSLIVIADTLSLHLDDVYWCGKDRDDAIEHSVGDGLCKPDEHRLVNSGGKSRCTICGWWQAC